MRIKIVFKSHYKEVNEQNNYIQKNAKNKKQITNLLKKGAKNGIWKIS